MNSLTVAQIEAMSVSTPSEVRSVGVPRARLWDAAMTCLRLCGRFDDDEMCDLIGHAQEQLEFRVGGEKAHQACEDACRAITAIPAEHSPEDDAYGRFA